MCVISSSQLNEQSFSPSLLFALTSLWTRRIMKTKFATSSTTCKIRSTTKMETLSPTEAPEASIPSTLLAWTGRTRIRSRLRHRGLECLQDRQLALHWPWLRVLLCPCGLAVCTALWHVRTSPGGQSVARTSPNQLTFPDNILESSWDVLAATCQPKTFLWSLKALYFGTGRGDFWSCSGFKLHFVDKRTIKKKKTFGWSVLL